MLNGKTAPKCYAAFPERKGVGRELPRGVQGGHWSRRVHVLAPPLGEHGAIAFTRLRNGCRTEQISYFHMVLLNLDACIQNTDVRSVPFIVSLSTAAFTVCPGLMRALSNSDLRENSY